MMLSLRLIWLELLLTIAFFSKSATSSSEKIDRYNYFGASKVI